MNLQEIFYKYYVHLQAFTDEKSQLYVVNIGKRGGGLRMWITKLTFKYVNV